MWINVSSNCCGCDSNHDTYTLFVLLTVDKTVAYRSLWGVGENSLEKNDLNAIGHTGEDPAPCLSCSSIPENS